MLFESINLTRRITFYYILSSVYYSCNKAIIHYDPWWNPAVENQATDRAYRIGQDKPVFVYKLIVANTIEQKILEMQERKRKLQDSIYDGDKQQDDIKFSGNELLKLLE